MSLVNGRRLTIAHISMGRWNREPLQTGSSEYDDRVGGGVSLTAVSDFDDNVQAPPSSNSICEKGIHVTESDDFNNTAKPSDPTVLVEAPNESPKRQASPESTVSTVSSVSGESSLEENAEIQDATLALMNMYNTGRRNRSATTPTHDSNFQDLIHGPPGNGASTAHSSPIKHIAQVDTGISETHQHLNGNTPYQHQSQIPAQIHYNAMAPVFTPTFGSNAKSYSGQNSPTTAKKMAVGDQSQGHVNGEAHSTQSTQVPYARASPGRRHYHEGGSVTSYSSAASPVQAMLVHPGPSYQKNQTNGFLAGRVRNQQGQKQGHMNGNTGHTYNGSNSLIVPTNGYQMPDGRIRERSISYDGVPYDEPACHGHWQYRTNNETPAMSVNGGSYQNWNMQNTPSSAARGYNYGLPNSASDGSMSQYYYTGQSNVPTALVQYDQEPVRCHPSVGPMDFGMPSKMTLANRSEMLQSLTEKGQPTLDDLLDTRFIPFIENYMYSYPTEENGVIVIKNLPYETTRGEIIALLGKTSKILNDRQEPIHIIMDRVTGKTQDAFCELSSLNAAIEIAERFAKGAENGRLPRLGSRVVEIELSSQTTLMKTVFPSSKNGVLWKGTRPQLVTGSAYAWENFSGFFTEEEMVMLGKHVENPQRTVYARICPERPYECMISTLRKIPWYMAENITIKQRHSVYECCMKMIGVLAGKINSNDNARRDRSRNDRGEPLEVDRLNPQLLDRLVTSAMLCPGFSVVQKHNIATIANLPAQKRREFNQPRFPDSWRHQWTLIPKVNMPIDVLEWYIAVIRAETERVVKSLGIHQKKLLEDIMEEKGLDGYWGFFWAEANFPVGLSWDNMSLTDCSRLEWQAIESILTRAIQGGNVPPSYTSGSYHTSSASTKEPTRLSY